MTIQELLHLTPFEACWPLLQRDYSHPYANRPGLEHVWRVYSAPSAAAAAAAGESTGYVIVAQLLEDGADDRCAWDSSGYHPASGDFFALEELPPDAWARLLVCPKSLAEYGQAAISAHILDLLHDILPTAFFENTAFPPSGLAQTEEDELLQDEFMEPAMLEDCVTLEQLLANEGFTKEDLLQMESEIDAVDKVNLAILREFADSCQCDSSQCDSSQ